MALVNNITGQAKANDYFRQVLATGKNTQVVIMSIPAGGDIGEEVHKDNDQVLYLISSSGQAVLDGQTSDFNTGDLVLVPAGAKHNFITKGDQPMKIITTYSPPHHPDGTIHKTKKEAQEAERKKSHHSNSRYHRLYLPSPLAFNKRRGAVFSAPLGTLLRRHGPAPFFSAIFVDDYQNDNPYLLQLPVISITLR